MKNNSTSDANKFPIESCRERIARRYGLDAVAISGPCKGSKLTTCICNQLNSRWENISNRFSGNHRKVVRLALKLANSFMQEDDTKDAIKAIENLGYKKTASNIAEYMKAYAISDVVDEEIDQLSNEVDEEMSDDDQPIIDEALEDMELEKPKEDAELMQEEEQEDLPEDIKEIKEPDLEIESVDELPETETVTFDIPIEVAKEINQAIEEQLNTKIDQNELDVEENIDPMDDLSVQKDEMVDVEIPEEIETEEMDRQLPKENNLPEVETIEEIEVPGEPVKDQKPGVQIVKSEEKLVQEDKELEKDTSDNEEKEEVDKDEEDEKEEVDEDEEDEKEEVNEDEDDKEEVDEDEDEDEDEDDENKEKDSKSENKKELEQMKESSSQKVLVKLAYPEMGSGNKPIKEKTKQVEDPKPISEGNIKTEGHAAGDNKFEDNQVMGSEKKPDFKTVEKSDVSGGSESLIGKDESFPEGKPSVPAGSPPIQNEKLTGGDVSTKGTVIATITPNGIIIQTPDGKRFLGKENIDKKHATQQLVNEIASLSYNGDGVKFAKLAVETYRKYANRKSQVVAITPNGIAFKTPDGKAYMAKISIEKPSKKLIKSIEALKWNGDFKKFASDAVKAVKEAKKEDEVKTDAGKQESENFTNDSDKKTEDTKNKKEPKVSPEEDGITKTDTAKKESENFQNCPEKKAKKTKEAADKSIKVAPISEGNFDTETKDGKKLHDNGKGTIGEENKFDAKKPQNTSGGEKSVMGEDEELPKNEFKIPSGEKSTNTMAKGTVIANDLANESKIKEARLKAASVYCADILRNDEITTSQYPEMLEKIASMSVQQIQVLAASTRATRERVEKKNADMNKKASAQNRECGLGLPVVISSNNNRNDLKERLVSSFKLTRDLDEIDRMKENEK